MIRNKQMGDMSFFIEVKDLTTPELAVYNEQSEKRLFRINEPEPGIFIAESPKVIIRALDAGYEPISMLLDKRQMEGEARTLLESAGLNTPRCLYMWQKMRSSQR